MDKVIAAYKELHRANRVVQDLVAQVLDMCREMLVPCITMYSLVGEEGWYEMRRAYILTTRTDAHRYVWYLSPRFGLLVCNPDERTETPFEEWDPEAFLFTDPSLHDGYTSVDPFMRREVGE